MRSMKRLYQYILMTKSLGKHYLPILRSRLGVSAINRPHIVNQISQSNLLFICILYSLYLIKLRCIGREEANSLSMRQNISTKGYKWFTIKFDAKAEYCMHHLEIFDALQWTWRLPKERSETVLANLYSFSLDGEVNFLPEVY